MIWSAYFKVFQEKHFSEFDFLVNQTFIRAAK